jgi:uncharacterized protein
MVWVSPNTITGDAATHQRYYRRDHINEYFWREVGKGNHILFVAPRRVGKSSIMIDLAENPPEGYACIYQNIEAVKSRNEFFKRLFHLILLCIQQSRLKQAKTYLGQCFKKYNITEITKTGIKFQEKELDYENELRILIPDLKATRIHTVIFLDEFAEVINRLSKNGKASDAIDILHTLREIRSDKDFEHFTLVFAGSIGLDFVIKSIDRPKLINDLHPIHATALTQEEGSQFIAQLVQGATIILSPEIVEHIKTKIHHLLPYYIQLMLEEIDLIARELKQPQISKDMIDHAFDRVLSKNKNFDDWVVRLKDYQAPYFPFINELLKHAAHKNGISVQKIYDKALDSRFNRPDDYMDFVEQLCIDGYLVETDNQVYRFISPFLKAFWLKKNPVYHG